MSKQRKKAGECRLCLKKAKLCHSHIVPEFFYKCMYGQYKDFVHMKASPGSVAGKRHEIGLREYLLCEVCEGILSKYEDYASRILLGHPKKPLHSIGKGPVLIFSPVNYDLFRRFQLSLLWRIAVTTRFEFALPQLKSHCEVLRLSLIGEQTPPSDFYPCVLACNQEVAKVFSESIHVVGIMQIQDVHAYLILLNGYMWIFFLSASQPNLVNDGHVITASCDLPLVYDTQGAFEDYMRTIVARIVTSPGFEAESRRLSPK